MTYPLVRMKFIADEKLMYGANESAELDDRDLPRYIRITDLNSEGNLKEDTFKSLEWEKARPYLLRKGDILFARSGATVGKAYIHETGEPACYAGYLIKLKVDLKKCLPKFVFYYTQTNKYAAWIAENTIQATIQNVSAEKYANLFLPLPSLKLQEIIIKYLENNVAHIDGLIAKKIKYIDLLEQQRQSIITETVTKGLNSNVKMKDSGVEWIGEVPELWEVSKLKNLFILQRGHDLTHEEFNEGEIPVYASNGIMGYHNTITTKGPNVTVGRSGSVGKVNYVETDFWAHNTCIYVKDNKKNNMKYIYYILKSLDMSNLSTQTAVPTLDRKNIQNSNFVYTVDIEEQREIALYLDRKLAQIDTTVNLIDMQLKKLKEYRQALIYEAVTGKIDVRDMELD